MSEATPTGRPTTGAGKDLSKARSLEATWDKLVELNPVATPAAENLNPYINKVEADDLPQSTEDENLSTAYVLLATTGLDSALGQMMAHHAEQALPQTQLQLFSAYESARTASNPVSHRFAYVLRGMLIFVYAWSYVMVRTKQLTVKDRSFYPAMLEISAAPAGSPERTALTLSAENRFETSLGLLLHGLEDAKHAGHDEQSAFFEGGLMALYALANLYYGKRATYVVEEA
jgi:hypothetical protein